MSRWPLLILAILTALPLVEAGQVYRWTDSEGNVHYSDRPHGNRSETVKLTPAPSPAGGNRRLESQRNQLEAWREERRLKREQKMEARAERKSRAEACQAAKATLDRYTSARYLYDVDENGNRVILSHEERAAREAQARAEVSSTCR